MIDKNCSSIFFSREDEEEEERKREKRIAQIDLITSQTRMQINDSTSHVTLLAGIQGKSRVARPHTHTHTWPEVGSNDGGRGDRYRTFRNVWREPVTRVDVTRLRGPKGRREDETAKWIVRDSCIDDWRNCHVNERPPRPLWFTRRDRSTWNYGIPLTTPRLSTLSSRPAGLAHFRAPLLTCFS